MHKRILERGNISKRESDICDTLMGIKTQADDKVLLNTRMLDNEGFFQGLMMKMVIEGFGKTKIELDPDSARYINTCLVKEYMNEYQGKHIW